jgi:hypothetical protein
MSGPEEIAVAGFIVTIAVNAAGIGIIYGTVRTQIRELTEAISAEGDEGLVKRREVRMMSEARDDQIEMLEAEQDRLRGTVDAHTAQLAVHKAQITILRGGPNS